MVAEIPQNEFVTPAVDRVQDQDVWGRRGIRDKLGQEQQTIHPVREWLCALPLKVCNWMGLTVKNSPRIAWNLPERNTEKPVALWPMSTPPKPLRFMKLFFYVALTEYITKRHWIHCIWLIIAKCQCEKPSKYRWAVQKLLRHFAYSNTYDVWSKALWQRHLADLTFCQKAI